VFNRKVLVVWLLATTEAVLYAMLPAVLVSVVSGETQLATAAGFALLAAVVAGVRQSADTRVLGRLLLQKAEELLQADVQSARGKISRWQDAISGLIRCGPEILRGIVDLSVGLTWLYLKGGLLSAGVTIAGTVPMMVLAWWVTRVTRETNTVINGLAAREGDMYAAGHIGELLGMYRHRYLAGVRMSDADAVFVSVGLAASAAAQIAAAVLAVQYNGVDAAVAVGVYYYASRYSSAIDRLYQAGQQAYAATIAAKV
jgi:hypothetical protein